MMSRARQSGVDRRALFFKVLFIASGYSQAGLSFLISIWLANYLGASLYGIFAYGLVHANIVTVVAGFGHEQSLVRDLVQTRNPARVLTVSSILRIGLFSVVISGYGIYALASGEAVQEMGNVMFLCVLSSASLCLSPRAWMDKDLRMWLQAIYTVVERLVFVVLLLIVFLGVGIEKGPIVVASCLLGSRVLLSGLEWTTAFSSFHADFTEFRKELKTLIKSNFPIAISVVANLIITQYAMIILKQEMDIKNVGYYLLATQFAMVVALLQNQMMRLQLPRISRIVREIREQRVLLWEWLKHAGVSIAATFVILIPMAIVVPLIIKYAMKPEFSVITVLFFVLLIRQAFFGLGIVTNLFLLGLHMNWHYFMITVTTGILSIFLTHILISKFGLIGAPISLVVSHGISILAQMILLFIKSFNLQACDEDTCKLV